MDEKTYLNNIKIIRKYIKNEMGGKVFITKNKNLKTIQIEWEKYDLESKKVIDFNQMISVSEFDYIIDPTIIAKRFVYHYRNEKNRNGRN